MNLDTITLAHGSHTSPADGACLLEVVALFAGQPFNDRPPCVSPVLRDYGIGLNDAWDNVQRQTLKRFVPLLPGTAGDGRDEARGWLALDWLIRTYTPAWLDLAGLASEAAELRSLRRIVDLVAARAAGPVVRNAQVKAAAAWDAARAVAWDAAGGCRAARDAAWAAARDAARAAARNAARAVAWDAAGAAAGAAARAALHPTVELLQASALDLFDAMINPAVAP